MVRYDPLTTEPEVNRLPLLNDGHVTFGCLNNFCKVNDGTLALLGLCSGRDAAIQIASARSAPGNHRQRVLDGMQAGGVSADRIEFVKFRPRAEYLRNFLSPHRHWLGYVPLQRPHHQPRFFLDGRSRHHARR